jgi:hypothetical protein
MAGLNKEIWLDELKEQFQKPFGWLPSMTSDYTPYVTYDVLHLGEAGVEPTVLENNNTYPVPTYERTDTAIELALSRLDTENTVLRNAEKATLMYDKMKSIVDGHRRALEKHKHVRAAHAYAPASNSTDMPVLQSTGDLTGGFRRMKWEDLYDFQKAMDEIGIPTEQRALLLTAEARSHLQKQDLARFNRLIVNGRLDMAEFGFAMVERYEDMPLYDSTGTKKAFGSAYASGDKKVLCLAWDKGSVGRADGTLDMFERLKDPEARGDLIGFQQRWMALPKWEKGRAAMITATS